MKRITLQLLQSLSRSRQQVMSHRRQLISRHQSKSHVHEQQATSAQSANSKPKPAKVYHQGDSDYDITRRQLYNWIASSNPTHFLTIQFPMNMRHPRLDVSQNNLRRLMARFEQCLIGSRWTKSHLPFYAFAEKSKKDGYTYHFHILFNAGTYDSNALQNALDNACYQLSLSPDICFLEEIETYEVIYYCLKGINICDKSNYYDCIILSDLLFNLQK